MFKKKILQKHLKILESSNGECYIGVIEKQTPKAYLKSKELKKNLHDILFSLFVVSPILCLFWIYIVGGFK